MKTRLLYPLLIIALLSACSNPTPTPVVVPTPQTTELVVPTVIVEPIPQEKAATSGLTEAVPPSATMEPVPQEPEVIAENLNFPWELAFLPDGGILVTERPGSLMLLEGNGERIPVEGIRHIGEGGLLGMALHPGFASNGWIYLYLTSTQGLNIVNRVERYVYKNHTLSERVLILEGIRGAAIHDGGRIKFGPDGMLYITTGDAGVTSLSQDLSSLNGKILRVEDDGSIPADNPFGTAVWSYGHRNPQGLAWDSLGRLWATEHGPSGAESGQDEVNLIKKGQNYGWPVIRGAEVQEGMVNAVIESGTRDTWAPSGAVIVNDVLYYVGLRSQGLYKVPLEGMSLEKLEVLYKGEYGRLRNVVLGADGRLYLMTSNGNDADKVIAVPVP
ncbi:MAG: PQQ-dependent sugar dehydrogenase [Anaerolineaceae bacterium]